ncbi:MAG: hypothetical protein AMXMBFR76_06730 [Pseudomonadota bacterium]|jgi:DNA end-binding protein Ku
MAIRAYWRGHLKLSLVSIAIELHSATQSKSRLDLHQIHKPTGKRVRYQKTVPGLGPVANEDIVKGLEVDKDRYVLIEPEELDALRLESRQTINLVQFVDYCEIDPRYFDRPYYVVPGPGAVAAEGYTVIRDALRDIRRIGLGQMAVRGRDYIVAIKPCGAGLLLETLRYREELRQSDRLFAQIPSTSPDAEMLDLARELIERKSAPFDAAAFKSQYVSALREMIEEKRERGAVSAASDEAPSEGKVIDLMEALKKSLAKDRAPAAKPKRATRARKRAAG